MVVATKGEIMKAEPKKAYVYQPFPPQADGRFYGVGGLHLFGLSFDDAVLRGVTKNDAEIIVQYCNDHPDSAADFVHSVHRMIADDWKPSCGCRFESLFSSAVLVCNKCSKHPAHNRIKAKG